MRRDQASWSVRGKPLTESSVLVMWRSQTTANDEQRTILTVPYEAPLRDRPDGIAQRDRSASERLTGMVAG